MNDNGTGSTTGLNGCLRMMLRIFAVVAIAIVAGCVTHPPPNVVQPWPKPPTNGYAIFMTYYPAEMRAIGPSIYIDDQKVFTIHANSYSYFYVKAGMHRFQTKWNFLMTSLNTDGEMLLNSGESYNIRFDVKTESYPFYTTVRHALYRVDDDVAKRQAERCWYRKPLIAQIDTTNIPPPWAAEVFKTARSSTK